MNSFLKRSMLVFALLAVSSLAVSASQTAKMRKVNVSIPDKVTVNGTVLKPGDYRFNFDEQSGQLTITRDGKQVAKTAARLEKRSDKARQTAITTTANGGTNELVSIAVSGEDENIVVGQN
ncbi:MAG TPA: hypothetical protein VIV66_14075 [Pyrinomonadaceae bacterium]